MAKQESKTGRTGPARVLIVDDHPALRRGLAEAIGRSDAFEVAGEAETVSEAKAAVRTLQPDAAVVDLTLGDESGLELIKDLAARDKDLPILVLSMHDETLYAERALRAGAKGYVMKDESLDIVLQALERVLDGSLYLSTRMSGRLLERLVSGESDAQRTAIESLTDRELEVFDLLGRGHSTREVADSLHLSIKTIYTHCENIKQKLGLTGARELHQQAFHWVQNEQQARGAPPA